MYAKKIADRLDESAFVKAAMKASDAGLPPIRGEIPAGAYKVML